MGNPSDAKSAPAAQRTPSSAGPSGRPRCQFGEQCFRKNPEHKQEFSHPGDSDWTAAGAPTQDSKQDDYETMSCPPCEVVNAEDRGFLEAVGGAAAAYGGMKVTGADSKLGFLGKAGLVVGAAVAGSMLQDHLSADKKGKKDKKSKKSKKDKKGKKSKSRELGANDRGLPEGDSDTESCSSDEDLHQEETMDTCAAPCTTGRPRCEFGERCFRKNPDHKKDFISHPGDLDWVAP